MALVKSGGRTVRIGLTEADPIVPGQIDPDEYLWRSLTASSKRDLPKITHDRAIEVCYWLYVNNPLGHRVTEINRDFIVGDGIFPSARNPKVDDIVQEFWTDGVNNLGQRVHDFALEIGLYGELCLEVFTGEVSGVTQLGYIDPGQIGEVRFVETNPLIQDVVELRRKAGEEQAKSYQIVRDRQGNGTLEGDVFFFRVNSVSNATRGWPDLLHVADWLDFYDQLMWDMAERSRLMRTFIWDVLVKGADEKRIREFLQANGTAPKTGTVRAHNEEVTWNPVAPQLGSFETAEELDVLLTHVGAGVGLPKHWLSSAGDVNRATALEMGAPSIRRLAQRQKYFLDCLRSILKYVVQKAAASGRLKTNAAGKVQAYDAKGKRGQWVQPWTLIDLHAPEISLKDQARAGDLLLSVAEALQIAETLGWMSKDPIRRALAAVLGQIGVDYDPAADDTAVPTSPSGQPSGDGSPASGAAVESLNRAVRRLARAQSA